MPMITKRAGLLLSAALVLGAAGAVFAVWRSRDALPLPSAPPVETVRSPEEIESVWRSGVDAALAAYAQDRDGLRARDALLRLTVPEDGRDAHLALVLALEAVRQARPDAETRWQKALALFRR